MFSSIAARYDLLNHLLSGNIDKRWRRVVARKVRSKLPMGASCILDVACGTGDLSITLFETTGAKVVATDFCRPMLKIAAGKVSKKISLVEGDALKLPFMDESFEAVTIAFGLRNLSSLEVGLAELYRVLKPGGWVAVLEFSKPANAIVRSVFGMYFTKVLPLMGGAVSGSRSAYTYLPASVRRFPDQNELASLIGQAGFQDVVYENFTGGIAALHLGRKQ
jgi:demethylmenaquinone methyltransferase / 2-methoxy-6-polyprenyl-1,4-benzoquinol methylase